MFVDGLTSIDESDLPEPVIAISAGEKVSAAITVSGKD